RFEPVLYWMERLLYAVNALFAFSLFLFGWLFGDLALGLSLLVWGFFLRIVLGWHATLLVNSVSHRWGYRNYPSRDNSRNCWWVALLTFGEGWHNNHHHRPRCAAHGHRWFEIDTTYSVIRLLEKCGLAQAVVRLPGQGASGPAPRRNRRHGSISAMWTGRITAAVPQRTEVFRARREGPSEIGVKN